jgi:hypothetical protein
MHNIHDSTKKISNFQSDIPTITDEKVHKVVSLNVLRHNKLVLLFLPIIVIRDISLTVKSQANWAVKTNINRNSAQPIGHK